MVSDPAKVCEKVASDFELGLCFSPGNPGFPHHSQLASYNLANTWQKTQIFVCVSVRTYFSFYPVFQIVIGMGDEDHGMILVRTSNKRVMCPLKYLQEI